MHGAPGLILCGVRNPLRDSRSMQAVASSVSTAVGDASESSTWTMRDFAGNSATCHCTACDLSRVGLADAEADADAWHRPRFGVVNENDISVARFTR